MLLPALGVLIILCGLVFFSAQSFVGENDIPKEIPMISGEIVSIRAFRSDDLNRGIEVVVKTNLSLLESAQYYNKEFEKRAIRAFNLPTFQGSSYDLEKSSEASGGGETENHQQVMIYFKSQDHSTLVTISILGDSIIFLPK
jgi:hypothetical protein